MDSNFQSEKNAVLEKCIPKFEDKILESGPSIFLSVGYGSMAGFVAGAALAGIGAVPGGLIGGASGLAAGIGKTLLDALQPAPDAGCVANTLLLPKIHKTPQTSRQ